MAETEAPPVNETPPVESVGQPEQDAPKETPQTEEPKLYAGKFKSAEDLEKAYSELQSSFTRKSQEAAEAKKATQQQFIPEAAETEAEPEISDVNTLVSKSGLDPEELATYYAEHGDLSDEHIEALQKASNLPAGVIRDAAAGLAARQQQAAATYEREFGKAAEQVGGKEKLSGLLQWASSNLTENEINFMNEAIKNDPSQMSTFADALSAKYSRATGTEPRQDLAQSGASTSEGGGVAPFTNLGEKAAALDDKRYAPNLRTGQRNPDHDPAYRQEVDARLRATAQARAEGKL